MNKQVELIRAEIERLKGQLIRGACSAQVSMETNCKDEAYNEVLAFINSLPKDEPSENIGQLEFLRNTAIEMIAALEHDISISIYDGKKGHDPEAEKELEQWKSALVLLDHLRESTKTIEPSEDLEQEIERFLTSEESTTYENAGSYKVAVKDPKKIARHFANWQKEQMMKEAVEGEACILGGVAYVRETNNAALKQYIINNFKNGDKVKIIIVKED